ncbi:hypothetical protein DBV15_03756 [Temnothorax longispinosus]|uniref:Uncharacterized protein n=1 Tax=Temnothorax longispinosus TaxID=300112 RepID=A0A4S2KQR8_9HYME|nr:hypothetical protein DBV15_03756 [Temnothorax longispinosus]
MTIPTEFELSELETGSCKSAGPEPKPKFFIKNKQLAALHVAKNIISAKTEKAASNKRSTRNCTKRGERRNIERISFIIIRDPAGPEPKPKPKPKPKTKTSCRRFYTTHVMRAKFLRDLMDLSTETWAYTWVYEGTLDPTEIDFSNDLIKIHFLQSIIYHVSAREDKTVQKNKFKSLNVEERKPLLCLDQAVFQYRRNLKIPGTTNVNRGNGYAWVRDCSNVPGEIPS